MGAHTTTTTKKKKKTGKELLKCVSGMFDWEKCSTKPSNKKRSALFKTVWSLLHKVNVKKICQ